MRHQIQIGVRSWLYLRRIMYKIERHLLLHLEKYDLTPAQFGVLANLQAAPEISQQALANRLFVTKGNIVGLLNRLECRGLVQRRPDPEDGRTHIVSLTEQGATLAAQVVPAHERLVTEYMGLISDEDQLALHNLLRTLNRSLGPD
ncbi:MarR family transcriptional regulator [Reticulibacter mediterranei]|uniref:MarR family transcriptional regulator n=1 Tax=Reticulibacter mediterranei TaxID=2778369 RepID=A0A8J3J0A9_9CHLR|nr:MarR family transcriptional regulator [Reticulibacter mediterranei]GHO99256.1 MarR family transcriptional regulator [Reticulibacter mediterranei]